MKHWLAVAGLLSAGQAWAGVITTDQSGISQVEIGGVRVLESTDAKTDGFVSVFALWGSPSTPEARTAARSGSGEMAANARLDDKRRYSGTDFSNILSQASYAIHLAPDNIFVNHAEVDFVLPYSYLEITNNIEIPQVVLDTVFLADLRVCFAVACSISDSIFHVQANLEGSYRSYNWSSSAEGNPQLDLTSFSTPTITDTTGSFFRTVNVGFSQFHGHVDLGLVPNGLPLTLEYIMQARAWGRGDTNIAISSVNDPFLLATDPVQHFDPLTVAVTQGDAAAAPEPATWLASLTGLAIVAWAAHRRRRA